MVVKHVKIDVVLEEIPEEEDKSPDLQSKKKSKALA